MMGDKAESEFIRAEYVDGKFREHDRKHKADMEGVKKSFEQAAAKHNELRGEVDQMKNSIVALQAEVKSLREMMVMYFQKGSAVADNTTAEGKKPVCEEEWMGMTEILNIIKEHHCGAKRGDLSSALVWAGYIERWGKGDGVYYKITPEGKKTKCFRLKGGSHNLVIKRSCIPEITNLVEDYLDFLKNARRDEE